MQNRLLGLPAGLTNRAVPLITAADAASVYAHPRPQLARLTKAGLLHRVAPGRYAIVPQNRAGDTKWRPTLEGAVAAIAMAEFGRNQAILMGVSAARIHHAIPRALAIAVVAVPDRKAPITMVDRDARCLLIERDPNTVDAELTQTDMGQCLVTTIEQTVLDLAHRPDLGSAGVDARAAITALLPRCDRTRLEDIARKGRRQRALARIDRGQV